MMYLGDGSEFTKEEVMECIEVADNHGLKINWKPGEAALVNSTHFPIKVGLAYKKKMSI